jgi:N-carbamoyl-L-amino-acid hydrolase
MTSSPTRASHLHKLKDVHDICRSIIRKPSFEPSLRPVINSDRLWSKILRTSSYGLIPGTTGMNRLALTQSDKDVRDWFVREASVIGCSIKVDAIGNIFAILPGSNPDLSPIGIGSHLDTQPSGK